MASPDGLPERLWLVQSFLDSLSVEDGLDDLETVSSFRRWLHDHGRGSTGKELTADDLEFARRLRAGLRHELMSHHVDEDLLADPPEELDGLMAQIPLRIRFTDDGPTPVPAEDRGAMAFFGEIAADVAGAHADGTWDRFKLCPADDCLVTYYDTSKNRSKKWCSMEVCGNRAKTRDYRRRQARDADRP